MTVDALRKIIHEEVRKAIREELGNMLSEIRGDNQVSSLEFLSEKQQESKSKEGLFDIKNILQETRKSMTREDYREIMGGNKVCCEKSTVSESIDDNGSSLVNELPSFAKNAKAIFEASKNVDKTRNGL